MQARDREMAELVQAKDTVAQAQEQLRKKACIYTTNCDYNTEVFRTAGGTADIQ